VLLTSCVPCWQFINHSKRPNCYCKIINVNSDYRIGLFALRDIDIHTEVRLTSHASTPRDITMNGLTLIVRAALLVITKLFFDYRYDKEMHHAELLKMPTVTEWMNARPKPPSSHRRGK
jgi:hypothetical protein